MKDYYKYIGGQFSRLEIIDFIKEDKPTFVCKCSCGAVVNKVVYDVLRGFTQSCGCLQAEKIKENGHKNLKPGVEIGSKFVNKKGREYEVIEYIRSHKVKVRFTDSGFEKWSATKEIKNCCVVDDSMLEFDRKPVAEKVRKEREHFIKVGKIITTKVGESYEVISTSGIYCVINFLDEFAYEVKVRKEDAKKGIRNPFRRCYSGIGYSGVGRINSTEYSKIHAIWSNMLSRCYDESLRHRNPTYLGCQVHEKWHNLQEFGEWVLGNRQFQENPHWYLDKDILGFKDKIYGSDTCCFVPVDINNLFTFRASQRGVYPIGVHLSKTAKGIIRFVAQCNIKGKRKGLGYFDSPEEAFIVYKQAKEEEVKRVANIYKDKIDPRVYEALLKWEVEITD